MPKKVDEIHDALMEDPDFEPREDQGKDSAAWAVAWANYNSMKKNMPLCYAFLQRQSVKEMKEQSLQEEAQAISNYHNRSHQANEQKDKLAAALFSHLQEDEEHHISELAKELTQSSFETTYKGANVMSRA
jgi:bacterioferritin (cytochrome b1)